MLIVAGPADGALDFRLFTWTGNGADAPQERLADLSGLMPEGIVELPDDPWNENSVIQLISDDGAVAWYGDGVLAKNLAEPLTKFRSIRVALGPVVPQIKSPSYLSSTNFSFTVMGRNGSEYIIESSDDDLASWITRGTVQTSSGSGAMGSARWSDRALVPSGKARFYRAGAANR